MLPKIRSSEDFLIAELGEELVVHDITSDKSHTLNPVAALVFKLCDGQTSPEEIARRVSQELKIPHAQRVTWLALDRLQQARLLATELIKPTTPQTRYACRLPTITLP